MAIIFLRHGQTIFNQEDKFQGVSDSPLTELGIIEAKRMNDFLKENFNIKKFFISPLPRVRQTYELASLGINSELIVVPELREVCYGNWEAKIRSSISKTILDERQKNRFTFVHPGSYEYISGESYQNVLDRLIPFFENLKKEDDDICIIAHNGISLCAKKYFEKLTIEQANEIRVSNDEALIVEKIENDYIMSEVLV